MRILGLLYGGLNHENNDFAEHFAGNELGAKSSAVILSLIETCEANGIEPEAYLKHALENIHTTKDLSQLLPQLQTRPE